MLVVWVGSEEEAAEAGANPATLPGLRADLREPDIVGEQAEQDFIRVSAQLIIRAAAAVEVVSLAPEPADTHTAPAAVEALAGTELPMEELAVMATILAHQLMAQGALAEDMAPEHLGE
jgi:hypothetical protein